LYDKTGHFGVFRLATGVIGLDFIMRLLLVEKKSAAKYGRFPVGDETGRRGGTVGDDDEDMEAAEPTESDALVPTAEDSLYEIRDEPGKLGQSFPILYCFQNPKLPAAFFLSFLQAALLGLFDATVPTEAHSLFGFNSQESGLLFIALDITYLFLGPIAGWAVDRFGTKPVAVLGFGYLVPALVLLRLPAEELVSRSSNIILYCALLALCGVGLAIIGPPSFVEASEVVQRYDKANPGFFGGNGPYAQLYGFSSLFFCAGLTIGPLAGGALRDRVGYGNMNAIFAAVLGIAVFLSFLVVGGRPRFTRFHREV
jgi:Na+/melibiose symporter-like transporter